MNHFELKVGDTTIRVHQSFRRNESAKITVLDDKNGQMKTLVVKPDWQKEQVEIELLTADSLLQS
jgi:N-acetylglutamate synthase-like GNAT family acetyltransferase